MGTALIPSTSSLLGLIDDAVKDRDLKVNSTIMRKALKALVNQDFKLSDWAKLFGATQEIIKSRHVSGDDQLDADGFYYLCVSQALQKIVKTVTPKIRNKELGFPIVLLTGLLS